MTDNQTPLGDNFLRGHLPAFIAAPGTQAAPTDPGPEPEDRKRRHGGTNDRNEVHDK